MAKKAPRPDCFIDVGDGQYLLTHTTNLPGDRNGDCDGTTIAGTIRVEENLRGQTYCDTLIHEWIHARIPMASEEWVIETAKQLTALLYSPEVMRRAGFQ